MPWVASQGAQRGHIDITTRTTCAALNEAGERAQKCHSRRARTDPTGGRLS